MEGGKQVRR